MGKQLEVPATIFFWALGLEISFLPTMVNHHLDGDKKTKSWENTMSRIIVSLLIGATLNFIEKIIIQLIAISFHLRTYADRIEVNKFQIGSLTKLYQYSKQKIAMDDSDFEQGGPSGPGSGARTPMQYLDKAQKNAREAFSKVGDVAGKVAGDFTGKKVTKSTHPHQVVLTLLNSPAGSQVLARRLWRTFVEDAETIVVDDLKDAFGNDDEAEAAFTMVSWILFYISRMLRYMIRLATTLGARIRSRIRPSLCCPPAHVFVVKQHLRQHAGDQNHRQIFRMTSRLTVSIVRQRSEWRYLIGRARSRVCRNRERTQVNHSIPEGP